MEATGKIYKILPELKGESAKGPWMRQEFIIETEEQFPRKICFSLWGEEKCAGLKKLALGDKVVVSFNAESREYNERWFTDLRCWKLDKQLNQTVTGGGAASSNQAADQNRQENYANSAAAPSSSSNLDEFTPDDDLPF